MTYAAEIVTHFVREVRSGRDPDASFRYLAAKVMAQEVRSEGALNLVHTPATFSAYVRKLLELHGNYTLQIEDVIAQNDRVFVRWIQRGWHFGAINGEEPTGKPLIEMTSAVYQVEAGAIVEYWLQTVAVSSKPTRRGT